MFLMSITLQWPSIPKWRELTKGLTLVREGEEPRGRRFHITCKRPACRGRKITACCVRRLRGNPRSFRRGEQLRIVLVELSVIQDQRIVALDAMPEIVGREKTLWFVGTETASFFADERIRHVSILMATNDKTGMNEQDVRPQHDLGFRRRKNPCEVCSRASWYCFYS